MIAIDLVLVLISIALGQHLIRLSFEVRARPYGSVSRQFYMFAEHFDEVVFFSVLLAYLCYKFELFAGMTMLLVNLSVAVVIFNLRRYILFKRR